MSGGSRVDSLFAEFAKPGAPGAAVAVARGESIVVSHGYGLADVENGVGVTAATAFRLASVTKQFTAAAILTLVEDGTLHLDDRLGYVLPGVPAYARDVRVRHLLSHTAGLPDYEPILGCNSGPQLKDRDVLALLHQASRLYFDPGTSWRAAFPDQQPGESDQPAVLRRRAGSAAGRVRGAPRLLRAGSTVLEAGL